MAAHGALQVALASVLLFAAGCSRPAESEGAADPEAAQATAGGEVPGALGEAAASSGDPRRPDGVVYAVGDHLERSGHPFVFQGVNGPAPWGAQYKPEYQGSLASLRFQGIAKMAQLGANAMRIVHFMEGKLPAAMELGELVAEVKRFGMVPVLGVWDRTCKSSPTAEVEDFWLSGEGAALAKANPDLVINPYNELDFIMGEKTTDHAAWAAYYADFVKRLRQAGIDNLVMIDAGGRCGQNPEGILEHGGAVFAADPLQNVVFSVHMYAFWETHDALGNWREGQWSVQDWITKLANAGVPVVFGEFGGPDPKTGQNYDVQVVLGSCSDGVDGRLFWMDFDKDNKPFYGVYTDLTWSEFTPIGRVVADWLKTPCVPK